MNEMENDHFFFGQAFSVKALKSLVTLRDRHLDDVTWREYKMIRCLVNVNRLFSKNANPQILYSVLVFIVLYETEKLLKCQLPADPAQKL